MHLLHFLYYKYGELLILSFTGFNMFTVDDINSKHEITNQKTIFLAYITQIEPLSKRLQILI